MANKSLGRGLSAFLNTEFETTGINDNIIKVNFSKFFLKPPKALIYAIPVHTVPLSPLSSSNAFFRRSPKAL